MKLKIHPLIFLSLIVSSFFLTVYGRHVGGPWVLFEILLISELPTMLFRGDLFNFLLIASALTGQLLFLFLGLRTVEGYKLWLLLLSPLLVVIPVITLLLSVTEFQKQTTQSAIPFFSMVVIFYIYSCWKLKKNPENLSES